MLNNDAWSAVAELAASQHGCFTRRQAAENLISAGQLKRACAEGLTEQVMPRVYRFSGAPFRWQSKLAAATLRTGGVASHRAAARLHGFDGFEAAPVELTIPRGHMPAMDGFVVHRWTDPCPTLDHLMVDGIACTSIAATLAQLGAVEAAGAVERTLDEALRRGAPLSWIQSTVERLHRRGPSGTGTLVKILADERRSGRLPDSWFERLVQGILEAAGVPKPVLQHEVCVSSGMAYRLDLAWPELSLGLECHSRRFHFGALKEAADHRRDLELAGIGWEVLYVTWEHRKQPELFIPHLLETLRTRSRQLGCPAA